MLHFRFEAVHIIDRTMISVNKNIIANFVGNVWVAFMSLVFIPLYIHFMGIEAYGLIGVFATMQAVFTVLDMGLGATMNREMARLSVSPNDVQETRNLARTLEWVYWVISAFIGVTVITIAPLISDQWLQESDISPETTRGAIVMMGLVIALRWPFSLYSAGLLGLQRQAHFNVLKSVVETFRSGGAVLVLWLVSPSIQAFLAWQIIIAAIGTFIVGWFFWHSLPGPKLRAIFKPELFLNIWRFTAGMAGISLMSVILSNMDKIVLSRMLSLQTFGYYMVASAIATALFFVISPIFSAILPRLTQLVASGDHEQVERLYHRSSQFMAVVVLPAAAVISLFSQEILVLWTSSPETANQAYRMTSVLIVGMALSGLMHVPYALQLAHGWTKVHFWWTVACVLVFVPLMILLTKFYGQNGAVIITLLISGSYLLCVVPYIHRRLIPDSQWQWYIVDIGLPLAATCAAAGLARILSTVLTIPMNNIATMISTYFIALMAALFSAPQTRGLLLTQISKKLCLDMNSKKRST